MTHRISTIERLRFRLSCWGLPACVLGLTIGCTTGPTSRGPFDQNASVVTSVIDDSGLSRRNQPTHDLASQPEHAGVGGDSQLERASSSSERFWGDANRFGQIERGQTVDRDLAVANNRVDAMSPRSLESRRRAPTSPPSHAPNSETNRSMAMSPPNNEFELAAKISDQASHFGESLNVNGYSSHDSVERHQLSNWEQVPAIQPPIAPSLNTLNAAQQSSGAPVERQDATPDQSVDVWQQEILTLDRLEQSAMANHPALAAAWSNVEALKAKHLQVGLRSNPRIGYSGQQLGSSGQAEQRGVYVEHDLVFGGKRQLDQQVVCYEIDVANRQLEAIQYQVATNVRASYYRLLCAQTRLELASELVANGNQAEAVAEALFASQEGSRRERLQARMDARAARNQHHQAESEYHSAWRSLAAAVGKPSLEVTPIAGDVHHPPKEFEWSQTLHYLQQHSPEVSAAIARVERARAVVIRQQAEVVPDVNVQGVVQQDNALGTSNGNLLVSLPIPLFDRNQGGIRQATHELNEAQFHVSQLELRLQQSLADVFNRYQSNKQLVMSYRSGILEDAAESLRLAEQGFDAQEVGFLELLRSQRDYFQINLDYLEAVNQLWAATAEIDGLLLSNSLTD